MTFSLAIAPLSITTHSNSEEKEEKKNHPPTEFSHLLPNLINSLQHIIIQFARP